MSDDFERALQEAKLDALYHLAYGASHELNNPLANISGRAQTLLRDEAQPDRRRMLASIVAQAARAHEMIADLMQFARPTPPRPERIDLFDLARTVVQQHQPRAAAQHVALTFNPPSEPLFVSADAVHLAVAIGALLDNSLDALPSGGTIEVTPQLSAKPVSLLRGKKRVSASQVVVADSGAGLTAEDRQHLFDPFYSGREAGRGLGFGLCKCWRIVTLHGGRIEVDNRPDGGAIAILSLPRFENRDA